MVTGIEHVAIYAKDTKKLSQWYIDLFDGKVVFDDGKGTIFVAFSDNSMLEFCKNPLFTNEITLLDKPGIRHVAFYTDTFDETACKIRNSNAQIIKDVSNIPSSVKVMFFRDPEGNILHIISREKSLV